MNVKYNNIIQNSIENLLLAEKQLGEGMFDTNESQKYKDIKSFWTDINFITQKLSFECTKLCISFTSKPLPSSDESSSLLESVEKAVLALVSLIYKLDPRIGKTVHQKITASAINTIQSARQLLRVIKDEDVELVKERYLQATGIAWEGCKHLSNCPKNNKMAVENSIKSQNLMICDAFDEISQALEGDGSDLNDFASMNTSSDEEGEEEEKWSERDKLLITPAFNLIKASKILYKRLLSAIDKNGLNNTDVEIKDFDDIYSDCKCVSETVDNLVLSVYPPLNVPEMGTLANQLGEKIQSVLKTATGTHIITESEQSDVEFINKAVDHNLNQLKGLLREF